MVDVVVYVSSVANPRKHSRKIECLESFAEGVRRVGGTVTVDWDHRYQPARLAVMLGWATTNTGGNNIALRKQVIAEQQRWGYKTMCIDASCWKYLDNRGSYLRYSLGGPFYDRAEYANQNSTPDKWNEISQMLGVTLAPNKNKSDGYILICMQRDGGFAMKTLNPIYWLQDKIIKIREITRRPIVIRPHPGQYTMADFSEFFGKQAAKNNIRVVDPAHSTLLTDLQGAHSAIFFNSSASVASVCEGIPIFVDDISCVSWNVANKNIADIENPKTFEREQWIYNLAAAHWSDDDARQGKIYQKFLPYI
jgi:hypothetical protein